MARGLSFQPYRGPENFSGFSGTGGATFFRVSQDAAASLSALALAFPAEFNRAIRNLGYVVRGEIKRAMIAGGPGGSKWPALSLMHVYRRLDLLKAAGVNPQTGKWEHGSRFALKSRVGNTVYTRRRNGQVVSRFSNGQSIPNAFARWGKDLRRGGLRNQPFGARMQNTIRYKHYPQQMRVRIGALSPSTSRYLMAVQGGLRGSRGIFQFSGSQPITPDMRRAFWAAGVPLRKGKTTLEQPKRPLVEPVVRALEPQIPKLIEARIRFLLQNSGQYKRAA